MFEPTTLLYVKAFHVVAVITWMCGIFYLPRLFVYHAMCPKDDELGQTRFLTQERKLLRGIMNPSAVVAIVLGLWLISGYGGMAYLRQSHWLHGKLLLVLGMIIHHALSARFYRRFAQGLVERGHVFFRIFNEVPVLLLIGIVILVVVKPF